VPKMKTHKGAKKRFKISSSGKILRAKGLKSHNRRKKAPRSKRMFDRMLEVASQDRKRIRRVLPYGL
jgi:large subunit ribosomal protein L35